MRINVSDFIDGNEIMQRMRLLYRFREVPRR